MFYFIEYIGYILNLREMNTKLNTFYLLLQQKKYDQL